MSSSTTGSRDCRAGSTWRANSSSRPRPPPSCAATVAPAEVPMTWSTAVTSCPPSAGSLPLAVAAEGARIFDESGRDYIDASSGPLAVSLGHGHPKVLAALRRQFEAVDYVHRTQFRNEAAEHLADLVTTRLGGGLDHVLFVGSGSEANEVAMKAAHMYWAAGGQPDKHRFASSSVSYHGNTAGALGASRPPRYAA